MIFFLIFAQNIDRGYTLEPVLTCTRDLCFEEKKKKNITIFHLKITIFTAVRNRSILHRHVIVMHAINRVDISWLHHGHRHTV